MPKKGSELSDHTPNKPERSQSMRLMVAGQELDVPVVDESSHLMRQVDICLVFDTTKSMSDKIDGLVNCMAEFVGELAHLQLDWRVTVVPFGDLLIGERVVDNLPFVSTRDAAQQLLWNMEKFNGGGNGGESSLEAVQVACGRSYRKDAVKILVVLTDEPPHETKSLNSVDVGDMIAEGEFICFVAAPDPRLQGPRVAGFRRWAQQNGGEWYPIGPNMDKEPLLRLLKSLVREIPKVAHKVLEAGSVRRYLELEAGQ